MFINVQITYKDKTTMFQKWTLWLHQRVHQTVQGIHTSVKVMAGYEL